MKSGVEPELTAEYLLEYLNTRLGIITIFALSGVGVLTWLATIIFVMPYQSHHPVWFWLLIPVGAFMATAMIAFILYLALTAALAAWIETRGKPVLKRIVVTMLLAAITALVIGAMTANLG